jgi:hypothetical protein
MADGGRLARGPMGDLIRERFDIREVGDGEAAWQAVLLDSSIRVVDRRPGTPAVRALDLLTRLRASKVQRIREMPAIALTGQRRAARTSRRSPRSKPPTCSWATCPRPRRPRNCCCACACSSSWPTRATR